MNVINARRLLKHNRVVMKQNAQVRQRSSLCVVFSDLRLRVLNPTNSGVFEIPPTQLVDRSYSAYSRTAARWSRIPPTQLVDGSYSAYGRTAAREKENTKAKEGGRLPWEAEYEQSTNCVGGIRDWGVQRSFVG